jgi:hypothetical protein
MGGAWDDLELTLARQAIERPPIQFDHRLVTTTHDQQRGCRYAFQRRVRQIGPTAARDHRPDCLRPFGRGNQSRSRACARAKKTER